ncbi:response regulator [Desulfonatronum thioautotrophicum]|uniref:response regulator n=1 Tax=Desulfonatronum thioautotrophicum TaxID=617001 RepID=UPI0005EBE4F7|nr:response regulator [Desulfonatronum thioautotrophicum]
MSKPKILLVDDETRFRTTVSKRLAERGQDVTAVGSGLEAIESVKQTPFDIVVLDVKMPGLNGLETLTELKKIRPELAVIMLTGHASVDSSIEGMKLGAFDYILKPCDIEELLGKIEAAHRSLTQ